MTKNPILNAAAASAYIALVASFVFYGPKIEHAKPPVLAPIIFISIFTFSAATMAYIFFYQPFLLFFDGKKKQAVEFAFKSFAAFAGITLTILAVLLSGILH